MASAWQPTSLSVNPDSQQLVVELRHADPNESTVIYTNANESDSNYGDDQFVSDEPVDHIRAEPYSPCAERLWEPQTNNQSVATPRDSQAKQQFSEEEFSVDCLSCSYSPRVEKSQQSVQTPTSRIQKQNAQDPRTWDVREVGQWLQYIGMEQYKLKFTHHCIDGYILQKLTMDSLKYELGIGPFGHRQLIMDEIQALVQNKLDKFNVKSNRSPSVRIDKAARLPVSPQPVPRPPAKVETKEIVPPAAFLGPMAGKMTVYDQQSKIKFELDRAYSRSKHKENLVQMARKTADIQREAVCKLKAELLDLERKNKLKFSDVQQTNDTKGRIPWHHVGLKTQNANRNPERIGTIRDPQTVEETFQPRISKVSRQMMSQQDGQGSSQDAFLSRLERDQKEREKKLRDKRRNIQQGPNAYEKQQKFLQKSKNIVKSWFESKGVTIDEYPGEEDPQVAKQQVQQQLLELSEEYQSDLLLDNIGLQKIQNARGQRRWVVLAAAIHTMTFLQRTRADIQTKPQKLKKLGDKLFEETFKGATPQEKIEKDLTQAKQYFYQLGWMNDLDDVDGITSARVDALVQRALYYAQLKAAERDTGKPCIADWNKFRIDGLDDMQQRFIDREISNIKQQLQLGNQPSAVDEALGTAGAGGNQIPEELLPRNVMLQTVELLSTARPEDLAKLQKYEGKRLQLKAYRLIRTRKFVQFSEDDIKQRNQKMQDAIQSLEKPKFVIKKEQVDEFFQRLIEDSQNRIANRDLLIAKKKEKQEEDLKKYMVGNPYRLGKSKQAKKK